MSHRSATPAPLDAVPAVTRIGRFYITRELGRGASGCVYLGHDPVIGRDIALKTVNSRLTNGKRSRNVEYLINEARSAGRLAHPHIVTIYDASGEDDAPFIAMEYLQGRELDRILADGRRFKPDEVASIAWKLADALDHAHNNQVIHRDVKPSNIFMVRDDHPKLMDFGIARAPNRIACAEDQAGGPYTIFRPRNRLGTPYYMAPEQAQGKPADERSDIYSLGAVMYEMLVGRKPFESEDPNKLLQQIAYKAPPAPREVDPTLPAALAQIVMRAMNKRPEKRYQEAQQMALDLKRFLMHGRRVRRRVAMSAIAASSGSPAGGLRVRAWLLAAAVAAAALAAAAILA